MKRIFHIAGLCFLLLAFAGQGMIAASVPAPCCDETMTMQMASHDMAAMPCHMAGGKSHDQGADACCKDMAQAQVMTLDVDATEVLVTQRNLVYVLEAETADGRAPDPLLSPPNP